MRETASEGERNVLRCRGEKGEENKQSTKKWCENDVFLCYSTENNFALRGKVAIAYTNCELPTELLGKSHG